MSDSSMPHGLEDTKLKLMSTKLVMLPEAGSKTRIWVPVVYLGREGSGTQLQCSCLENPMDRGTW